MEQQLISYFTAEKQEALLFMLVGVAALTASAWLFKTGGRYKGMLYPLAAIALIQVTVGSTVYFRTDGQVAALSTQHQEDRAAFRAQEKQRMEAVTKNFVVYRWIEILLLGVGVVLVLAGRRNELWYAVGLGLTLQSAIMLVLDYLAERRADEYLWFVMGVAGG
jgi:hypothetical protein